MGNPFIFGCSSLELSTAEKEFFKASQPLGFILFARNCREPNQVRDLIQSIKECVDHKPSILIDQEGGRVVRLTPPHWPSYPSVSKFGELALKNLKEAEARSYQNAFSIGADLFSLGITVNCAPCLDLLYEGADPIIGDRSYSKKADIVASLGISAVQGFLDAGITPVIKHLPGHGRCLVDSHEELPRVATSRTLLEETDFFPFRKISESSTGIWGMTGHVIYDDIDPFAPATQSKRVIHEIIRGHIGFKGFLISDCLTMKALQGSFDHRAQKALEAGCDAVLHCSGDLDEMKKIVHGILKT